MSGLPDYPDSPYEDLKKRSDKRIAELEAELAALGTSMADLQDFINGCTAKTRARWAEGRTK